MNVIAEGISRAPAGHEPPSACIIQPVVLAGGSGTRLWPLSREQCPKQLIGLTGDESLLEATLRRTEGLRAPTPGLPTQHSVRTQRALVVCSEELRLPTKERLERCACESRVVLEPAPRNTAPALTVAALAALADAPQGEDPVLVVMPADHLIVDDGAFISTLQQAVEHALHDAIVALGVPPERAETGYGYIKTGLPADALGARTIERFVEKPAQETAERYVASGEYWWNSGIFVMRASVWLAAITSCRPDIVAACRAAYDNACTDRDGALLIDRAAFTACPSDSIDYAVMEHIGDDPKLTGIIVPLTAGWSDVGAWDAVWNISAKDAAGNVARGRVLLESASDTYAHSEGRLVACVGVTGVVVVETADAVLVAAKDRVQDVKAVVNRLNAAKDTEAKVHRKVERPWGCYDSIDRGDRFQVKRIIVKPGGRLSLQMHHHRAEHWIVVRGTARVTRGDETFLLTENQSTYIPLGVQHRLENPGKTPLEIIEVQSGGYLGEDDIVRFDDQYGRTGV
ncbi:mannose-1-phosphate guanylyltransferase/mannose-6-phosphate isomerase [Paraburkholderia diazotrophica]|uniref:mannose-1-phosphate guanylyltransferase n=1 Tax=Paraburkholderia diazotrophica TaxID=667676 RepID=A0A1H7DRY2_9BURK|nr:mannose-1-phosphate guanylyltransferase/mannose-6-phosphate isomerase [Paraburkholderia diazotrophica]SEK02422.1 mannose-1-phosphate guanylyltransferase / mannose-6-phosphate isomerase [Paraburkholderia diazotrophica]